MKTEKLNKSTKIIFIIIAIVLIIIIFYLIKLLIAPSNSLDKDELYDIVVVNEHTWNVFYMQNLSSSGKYMGYIYDKDYNVDSLSSEFLTTLVVDNYIATHEDFYSEKNYDKNTDSFKVTINQNVVDELAKNLFGPDFKMDIIEMSYGCNRKITKSNSNYVIDSKLPDSCGLFSNDDVGYYKTVIDDYDVKSNKEIEINLKVAFIEELVEEQYGANDYVKITYNAYSNKNKKQLIKKNVSSTCLNGDNIAKDCYNFYIDYIVTLRKASDNKYYFYSIKKV